MSHGSIFTIKGFVADANVGGVPREVEFKDGCLHIRGLDIGEARELLRQLAPPEVRYVDGDMKPSVTAPPKPAPEPTPAPKARQPASKPPAKPKDEKPEAAPETATQAAPAPDTPEDDKASETRAQRRARLRKEREEKEAAERAAAAKEEAARPALADPGKDVGEAEPDGGEADLEVEDLAAAVAAEGCVACGGTGKNSRGGACRACQNRSAKRSPADEAPPDEEEEAPPPADGNGAAEPPLVEHGAAGDGVDERLLKANRLKHVLEYLMQHEGLKEEKELLARCKELQDHVPALQRVGTNLGVRVKRTLTYVMKN